VNQEKKNGWKGMDVARKLNNQEYTEWTRMVENEVYYISRLLHTR